MVHVTKHRCDIVMGEKGEVLQEHTITSNLNKQRTCHVNASRLGRLEEASFTYCDALADKVVNVIGGSTARINGFTPPINFLKIRLNMGLLFLTL